MKKRIISFLVLFCLLISIVPQSAFAATGYKVYVNGTEFTSAKTTIDGVTFDDSSSTLTFRNVTLNSSSNSNAVITAERNIRINFYGTNTINLSENSTVWHAAFELTSGCYISGNSGSSLVINSASKNCTSYYDNVGGSDMYRIGILSTGSSGIMMFDMNITMNDNSQSSYLGHSILFDVYGGGIYTSNSKINGKNLYTGIFSDGGDTNYNNTEFNLSSSVSNSHGIATSYDHTNIFRSVTGTISADFGMRCYGSTEIYAGGSGLNITGTTTALYIDKINQNSTVDPTVLLGSGTVNLKGKSGICVEDAAKLYFGSSSGRITANIDATETGIYLGVATDDTTYCELYYGEVNIKNATTGVVVNAGSKLEALGCDLNLVGNGANKSIGIHNRGTTNLKGNFDISNYQFGIYTDKSTGYDSVVTISGSRDQSISASLAGIYSIAGEAVIDRDDSVGYRCISITAPYGISPYFGDAVSEIRSGTVNINTSTTGILVRKDDDENGKHGKMKISGGKISIIGTGTEASTTGIVSTGDLEITGTADISFKNHKIDINDISGTGKISGGNVHLSSSGIGMYLKGDYEVSGGVIDSTSCSNFAIVHENGTLTLSGGEIDINDTSVCLTAYGNSSIKFAGSDVSLKTTEQVALYSTNGNNSYVISGGTLELKGSSYAANFGFTGSLPTGYSVLAGGDESNASSVANPTSRVVIDNKYVKFTPPTPYTLTLENVAEGTSATVGSGTAITYTAAEAPVGKHFDHWEMKIGEGSFTSVGSNATYTGTMPASNTTLKAVYADCIFDAEIVSYENFADNANCEHGTLYYYSCSVCGDSARYVENGSTFENGAKGGHEWSSWFSDNNGTTHSRVCAYNHQHTDTENCSGGSATCTSKAVCTKCLQEYGSLGDHSFTARNTDSKYLCKAATCANKATYYYSCSNCGLKGTATFEVGDKLDHNWGSWTSQGDGSHKRVCNSDPSHFETGTCSGGTATTDSKAVCTVCGGEYGSLVPKNITVTIPTKAALAGNEVTVSVLIDSNPGLSHFEATITYDSSVLTLVGVSNGGFFDSSAFNAGTIANDGTYNISFNSSSNVMKASEVLVDLKFKVKDGTAVGTYPITVKGNAIAKNALGGTVDCVVTDGGVKVAKPSSGILGDVDGDGRVTSKDLLMLKKYLNGTVGDADMFYIECADLDGNGKVTSRDLLKLKQYLLGII